TENGKTPPSVQMDKAVQIIRDRVNGLGVSESEVTKQGSNNIIVGVPGQDQSRTLATVGTTAKLQFRQVFAESAAAPQTAPKVSTSPGASATPGATTTPGAKTTPGSTASPGATA